MKQMIMTGLPLALMGTLTGIYWSVEIHDRRIATLTATQYRAMHQMRDATFAKVMPVVGMGTFLIAAAAVVMAIEPGWPSLIGSAALMLMAADIGLTVSRQLPLNQAVQSWTDATIPDDWQRVRDQWAMHHRVRTVLLTLAYGAMLVAVMMTWA